MNSLVISGLFPGLSKLKISNPWIRRRNSLATNWGQKKLEELLRVGYKEDQFDCYYYSLNSLKIYGFLINHS